MWICRQIALVIILSLVLVCPGHGEESDIFDFFEEEAKAVQVVTGSRLPASIRWSPATVYVVTDEDLASSGEETLWDVLRGVPGVDVIGTRTFYGEVGIRGLNKALNNRTLVLLDGRNVLNGPFDATFSGKAYRLRSARSSGLRWSKDLHRRSTGPTRSTG
ncbi:MAG: TonB-dependent receptor plug domain-containing protein [Candidatus Latescibacteria bacterium]|jgi:outer membrane receptor for ferrienterochelin and colicin|nr:TonB-dependent receptor plug domain-containing protein [Candidatus Latescibacterota bacterium]